MQKKDMKNEMSENFIKHTADIHSVTVRYVYMVLKGERNNASIEATYKMLMYGKNKLVEAVERTLKAS